MKDKSVISIYSEVIIIFDNVDIKEQIREINHIINNENYKFMKETYYFPFFILITCKDLDLKYFIESKTFQYKIEFDNINIFLNKKENLGEFFEIIKKINSLFIYYNELGDEFSFINSEGKEVLMKSVDDTNIPIFINILLLGRSGAGKSTLVNLMLDEKKSLEGGTGFSTTSKKIIIYKKENIPIRFFDVKGAEDGKSIEDNLKLLTIFNGKISNFDINLNAIFYCIKFDPTTVILNFEKKIFEKLIEYNIPIVFIITHTPFDPRENVDDSEAEDERESQKSIIINAIKNSIKEQFYIKNIFNENEINKFFDKYIKYFFVNSVRNKAQRIPVFGIDEVLSFFTNLVPKKNWDDLLESCDKREEEKCLECLKENIFLNCYKEFDRIKKRNKNQALLYLDTLKNMATFTGWIPIVDFGIEYYYRSKFTEKLKYLYGFDYEQAGQIIERYSVNEESLPLCDKSDKQKNSNKLEEKIENKIDNEVNNKWRNALSFFKVALPVGGKIVLTTGFKAFNFVCLPISVVISSVWSRYNIEDDCLKILEIFEMAFTPLRFEVLKTYINALLEAIKYLDNIGKKIIIEGNKKKSKKAKK